MGAQLSLDSASAQAWFRVTHYSPYRSDGARGSDPASAPWRYAINDADVAAERRRRIARLQMRHALQQEERNSVMTQKPTLRRQDRIIGGVCGGLGAFFDVNPWWFRLAFLILLAPGGLPGF